jgi:hypothetical protein
MDLQTTPVPLHEVVVADNRSQIRSRFSDADRQASSFSRDLQAKLWL